MPPYNNYNNWSHLDTANVYNGAIVQNELGGTIGEANVYGGQVRNESGGTIGEVNVNDGGVANASGGDITKANVNAGFLDSNGTIGTVIVNGGLFSGAGTTEKVEMNGGLVANFGLIEKMTYTGGIYIGRWQDSIGQQNAGTLGELTVAGLLNASDSIDEYGPLEWGAVGSVQFTPGGIFSLMVDILNSQVTNTMQAQSVDLTYGAIMFDLVLDPSLATGFSNAFFSFDDIFKGAEVTGWESLASFGVTLGGDTIWVSGGNGTNENWTASITDAGIALSYSPEPNPVPEPATLLMLGLGALGAGLARRGRQSTSGRLRRR